MALPWLISLRLSSALYLAFSHVAYWNSTQAWASSSKVEA